MTYCRGEKQQKNQARFLQLLHMLQNNLLVHYFPLEFEIVWLKKILYLSGVLNP